MNKSSQIILSSLLCGCWMQTLAAASESQEISFMPYSKTPHHPSESKEDQTVQANRLNIRQIEGKGIGYTRGYTTLETFLTPFRHFESYLPFVDLRAHRFDDGKYAFNTGLGFRHFVPDKCRIWGVNAYYDYRQTPHKNYKQIGVGIESLGRFWDYRVNGYIPFGKHKSSRFDLDFDRFSEHNFFVKYKHEFAMTGVDAEAAYHWMPSKNIDVTAAAGPYYFQGHYNEFAAGGKIRAKARFLKAISLEGIASYDNLFKWNGQGQLTFSIPLGPKLKDRKIPHSCRSYDDLEQRLVQPVERDEIIVAAKHTGHKIAIDPLTGLPFNIMFVDNDPVQGDGTFESRFLTLAEAQMASRPHDIIYVFAGDGTTTGMDAGFAMQDFQKLFGSGIKHQVQTTLGKVKLPALSSAYPAITNTAGANYVIQMANNCEISGLYLPAVNVAAFHGGIHAPVITNAIIDNNIVVISNSSTNQSFGIGCDCCNGAVTISNNRVSHEPGTAQTFGILVDDISGVDASCSYSIFNNTISGNSTTAVSSNLTFYLAFGSAPSNITATVYNNTITNHKTGLLVQQTEDNKALSINIFNNTFSELVGGGAIAPLDMGTGGSLMDLNFYNNTIKNCNGVAGLGAICYVHSSSSGTEPLTVQFHNNLLQGNTSTVILATGTDSSANMPIQINNNFFQANTASFTLYAETLDTSTTCLQVNNNSFDLPVSINETAGTLNLEIPVGNTYPSFTTTGVHFVPAGTCE